MSTSDVTRVLDLREAQRSEQRSNRKAAEAAFGQRLGLHLWGTSRLPGGPRDGSYAQPSLSPDDAGENREVPPLDEECRHAAKLRHPAGSRAGDQCVRGILQPRARARVLGQPDASGCLQGPRPRHSDRQVAAQTANDRQSTTIELGAIPEKGGRTHSPCLVPGKSLN